MTAVVVSKLLESQSSPHLLTELVSHHQLPLMTKRLKSATTIPAMMGSKRLSIFV